jgi:hypothetical protein
LLFQEAAERVASEMLDAAFGRGDWTNHGKPLLDAKERAALLKVCLEYGVGRARPADVMDTEDSRNDTRKGISFGVAEPVPPVAQTEET